MALRTSHGNARTKGLPGPRVEVLPPDELPPALGCKTAGELPQVERDHGGRFTREGAALAGARGGRKSKGRPSLVSTLGIAGSILPSAEAFTPYRRKAASFRKAHTAELAALAGGTCGSGPSSMVASASLQLAASRYLYDLATMAIVPDPHLLREARQQADSSRQNLLAAYELAIREGRVRGEGNRGFPDVDEVTRRAEAEAEQRRQKRRAPVVVDAVGESAS